MTRNRIVTMAGGLLVMSAAIAAGRGPTTQNAAAWNYAYVTTSGTAADICYIEAYRCRLETVAGQEVNVGSAVDVAGTSRGAVLAAIHRLGEAGWEMTGFGPAIGHPTRSDAVHFRRPGRR